jgi:hypothetical protein
MTLSKSSIIIFIFFINSMVEISTEFTFGGVHSGLVRGFMIIALIAYLVKDVKFNGAGLAIVFFLLYMFILITRNTHFIYALNQYTGLAISLLMFPVALSHFNLKDGLPKLRKCIFIVLYILSLHFILAQIFSIGEDAYGLNVYLGGGGIYQAYTIVYILLFLPFIVATTSPSRIKSYELAAVVLSIIPVLMIFRRAAVLSLFFGIVIFILFTKERVRLLKYAFAICILFIPVMPFALETVSQRLEARSLDIEQQQMSRRGGELPLTIYVINTSEMERVLFGSEMFDYKTLANTDRSLHVDIARLTIGAGITGFALYLFIYFRIWSTNAYHRKKIKDSKLKSTLFATLLAFFVSFAFFSYSSQLTQVSSLSTVMTFFGILTRYTRDYYEINKSDKNRDMLDFE